MNISRLLTFAAACFPERPAVSWRDRTLRYRDLDDQASAFSCWLRGRRADQEQRVALFMDNRPEFLATMFGAFRAGATVVPCNSRLTADELRYIIEDADVSVVVTDEAHVETVRAAAGSVGVCVAGPELDAILEGERTHGDEAVVVPSDTAWIFYTSGTTGNPKGALLSHAALDFVTISWLADLSPMRETDVTLHSAPLSHGAGFHALATTARGAHHVITPTPSFDPAEYLRLVNAHSVTNAWLVPTQIVMLTDSAPVDLDVSSLQYVVYGGAPIAPAAIARAIDRFGPIFVQLYGQGESPMTITMLRREDHRPELVTSAGRPRVGIEVAVLDENGVNLPAGEIGEIVVRGPSVMSGYLNRQAATKETLRDGWLHTGDLGRMTEDQVLYLLDRAKDMIISGGSNVYAVEVEQALSTHPAVVDVAVIGLPDELWGEIVTAVVVPADPAAWDEKALDAHCRERLASYKLPRRWATVAALPRNAYGKVLKRDLRSRLTSEA